MIFTVKVNHRKFLEPDDASKLNSFGIKTILNNHVYREYSSHFLSTIDIDESQLEMLMATFNCEIDGDKITVNMGK